MTDTEKPKPSTPKPDPLFKHVAELRDFSSAMMTLAEFAPKHMTMAQASFFLLAAGADLAGRPTTFSAIRDATGPVVNRSLHSTYKVLLDGPNRKETPDRKGLGWLYRESNPADEREKFLRLTPEGRRVIRAVIMALTDEAVA